MVSTVVGSVTAELVLDSSPFVTGLEEAKRQIKGLSGNVGKTNTIETVSKQVKELKITLERSAGTMKTWAETEEQANQATQRYANSLVKLNTTINNSNLKVAGQFFESMGMGATKSGEQIAQLEKNIIKMQESMSWGREFTLLDNIITRSDEAKVALNELNANMEKIAYSKAESEAMARRKKDLMELKAMMVILDSGFIPIKPFESWIPQVEKANAETRKFTNEFIKLRDVMISSDFNTAGQFFRMIGDNATRSGEEVAQFEKQIIALKDAITAGRKFTFIDEVGRTLDATSPKIAKIRAELERLYASMSQNSTRTSAYATALNQTIPALSNLSKNTNQTSKALTNMTTSSANVSKSVSTMNGTFGGAVNNVTTLGTSYNTTSGMASRYADSANKASTNTAKLSSSTASASKGMANLTTATTRLHSALSSVKMMATALSSMFVWTFGMSLYQATKLTLESKNEMESYLHQMGMGRGSINLFNQGLDETADRFKKLNKYMIGETIASIGMEFDLTANQMKKSMEVVAMVQNEYVRAGRKESEASLAVKDILQGEFLRLSRETGVGKQDLIDTGLWQGDLKDVEGLMEALKKVGEDRHWDLFASKCNSLNDVISETRNRISEFGASLADQISPAIITAFNKIITVIDGVTSTWESFDPTTKIAVGATAFLAFSSVLMMVAGNLSLLDIATMGYSKSLLTTLLKLDVATVKEYGLVKAIVSKITALEAETVAEIGSWKALATKILGLDAYLVKEYGLSTAINVATGALDLNTVSVEANTVAEALNSATMEEETAIVGAFTVVKELEEAVMAEDTVITADNMLIHELSSKVIQEETVSVWGLISAFTVLKAVTIVGVIAGIAITLGSLALQAQEAKEKVDGFYDVLDNGESYINEAKDDVERYTAQIQELNNQLSQVPENSREYQRIMGEIDQAESRRDTAQGTINSLEEAYPYAKNFNEEYQNTLKDIQYDSQGRLKNIYQQLGQDADQASDSSAMFLTKAMEGANQLAYASKEYDNVLNSGFDHIDQMLPKMKEAEMTDEQRLQYAEDYSTELYKNAELWKKWNEGDFWAGFGGVLSDLKLQWIDLTEGMFNFNKIFTPEFEDFLNTEFNLGEILENWWNQSDFSNIIDIESVLNENIIQPWNDWVNNLPSWITSEINLGEIISNWWTNDVLSSDLVTEFQQSWNNFWGDFDLMEGIMNIFGGDTGEGAGITKDIPENNFINQLIHNLVGDDPWGSMQSAVDMYIIQPFSQGIQNGLANIPIVGDILSMLGLIDSTAPNAEEKGNNLGVSFGTAVEGYIRNIPIVGDILSWLGLIDSTVPTANSKGNSVGSNIKEGVNTGKQGTAQLVRNEMAEVISAVSSKVGEAYSVAQGVGSAILNGINSIIQHHSPGIPAKLIMAEMSEIQLAMDNAVDGVYLSAQSVGEAITTGIQPNTDISVDAEALAQYRADSMVAMGMADETVTTTEGAFSQLDMSTGLTFANIGNTIGTTMTNIATTTKTNYQTVFTTTKTQLSNMQSETTKNINQIKTSWNGMQTALINSAEHIRSETGAKIHSLQNNMATFWRKVQNPALLLGAGSPSEEKGARRVRHSSSMTGVRNMLSPKGFAGTPKLSRSSSNPQGASTGTGISDKYKNKTINGIKIYDALNEYLECLQEGKPCYAGGWDFNWSKDIKDALLKWHTHFGDIYDPYLYVGKFENDTFPVRGIAPIAKNYIYDAIRRTQYDFYYDHRYDPLTAWNRGAFNCYDGALLVMALARAFGFPNATMVHGSWDGIAHVWARIAGLGDIDATAIQGGYGFTASKVTGAGGDVKPHFKHNRVPSSDNGGTSNTFGDIHIHIDGTGKDSKEIGDEVRNVMVDLMSPNPSTGY
jgi:hypothetical protein